MKKRRNTNYQVYNFSDCREITGEELYLINGGERVENSNEAVANAQVGGFATGAEIINAVNNPSFDTISDAVIDSIGLFPGGLAWSIGLDVAKTVAEKIGEEIEKGVQYYKYYKINEMYSAFLPENGRTQNIFEPNNMFMKMTETGVKQLFTRN